MALGEPDRARGVRSARARGRGSHRRVDLRTDYEVDGSPSPLEGYDGVRYHHHSFFREAEDDDADILDRALPWVGYQPEALTGNATADSYLAFLADRPDSVLGALRAIADAPGAALAACAFLPDVLHTRVWRTSGRNAHGAGDETVRRARDSRRRRL